MGNYLAEFNKSYENQEEFAMRVERYVAVDSFIQEHNQTNASYTVGHNQFSDWTAAEYKSILGYKRDELKVSKTPKKFDTSANASSVNWVDAGPSPPPDPSRVPTSSPPVSSSPSLSSSSSIAPTSPTATLLATVASRSTPTTTTRMATRLSSSPSTPTSPAPPPTRVTASTTPPAPPPSLSPLTTPSPQTPSPR